MFFRNRKINSKHNKSLDFIYTYSTFHVAFLNSYNLKIFFILDHLKGNMLFLVLNKSHTDSYNCLFVCECVCVRVNLNNWIHTILTN